MASALTLSDLVHIRLDVIQLVAMVLVPLQGRGLGETAAGGNRDVQMDMRSESLVPSCQVDQAAFDIGAHACTSIF